MTEIKPCLFCGSVRNNIYSNHHGYTHVRCADCLATGPLINGTENAIASWNRIHDKPEEQKSAERFIEMINEDDLRRKQRFELVKAVLPTIIIARANNPMTSQDPYHMINESIMFSDAVLHKLEEK